MTKYQGAIHAGALWVVKKGVDKVRLTGFEDVIQRPQPVFGWVTSANGLGVRAALRQAFSIALFAGKADG
jgi:hypothetical protein